LLSADKPGRPKGPLDIVDVFADRAALLWDRPDNDGGSPITHYVVEMKEAGKDWKKVGTSEHQTFLSTLS